MNNEQTNTSAARDAGQTRPNYRLYDQTGSGVTQDIYAESLNDAIEQGREWMLEGDWGSSEDGVIRRNVTLEACVREIVYSPTDEQVVSALTGIGYDIDQPITEEHGQHRLLLSVDDNEDDDSEDTLAQIRDALPDSVGVAWTGDSNTNAEGDTTSDIELLWAPDEIDEDATDEGESWDCSGSYSDEMPECPLGGGGRRSTESAA